MNRRDFVRRGSHAAAVLALPASLIACDARKEGAAPGAPSTPAAPVADAPPAVGGRQAYELAATANGFTVGPLMAAQTVYVFFDPACPHCAQLWNNAKPLLRRLKMVWIPVGLLRRTSAPQGATILAAAEPPAAMDRHEASVLQGQAGIEVAAPLPEDLLNKVQANTQLFDRLGIPSVPLIVFRNARSGEYGTQSGSVETQRLAELAGI